MKALTTQTNKVVVPPRPLAKFGEKTPKRRERIRVEREAARLAKAAERAEIAARAEAKEIARELRAEAARQRIQAEQEAIAAEAKRQADFAAWMKATGRRAGNPARLERFLVIFLAEQEEKHVSE